MHSTHDDQSTTQHDDTAQGAATETPKHYSSGSVKPKATKTEGDETPPPVPDAPPPPPPGLKPNDLVAMPAGSVSAPSSFPGGTPPVDVVVPEATEPEGEPKQEDE